MSRRTMIVLAAAAVLVLLVAAPAFAEGYNNPIQYTRANGYFSGPHGGYTTTTNKCQDCHSTHYASGSFMLLRANSREAACDYCHGGGGGSTINIMMDNDYRSGSYDPSQASAIPTETMGYGTGHTLGYKGNAPADIKPAYSDTQGFSCFDCHTPHGNSARVLTTFANPGRLMGTGASVIPGSGNSSDGTLDTAGEWGIDPNQGNFKIFSSGAVAAKPIWPTGRFLLLKDPHSDGSDTTTYGSDPYATDGKNKIAIDWDEPLGPADAAYGGVQDNDPDADFPWATDGFLSVSEFCTDCHDGTAGMSTQAAEVWQPNASDTTTGTYTVAYSHDAQPRH
ncbi:hypothetical protein MX659_06960 [Coriobacteriia bacterium Es71-Z0120]|uniref:multiheme c-type cytochrome n=1 Tax=Parvivirga hydrogeniphila TaxID=2939460 RepID=UPI002260F2C5|nr:multiheme c-type cytochrome [Parvivirga hydrogeniphila]MCL4079320.1 hypothetical protein [Parvivirga hydrogeniphila]